MGYPPGAVAFGRGTETQAILRVPLRKSCRNKCPNLTLLLPFHFLLVIPISQMPQEARRLEALLNVSLDILCILMLISEDRAGWKGGRIALRWGRGEIQPQELGGECHMYRGLHSAFGDWCQSVKCLWLNCHELSTDLGEHSFEPLRAMWCCHNIQVQNRRLRSLSSKEQFRALDSGVALHVAQATFSWCTNRLKPTHEIL